MGRRKTQKELIEVLWESRYGTKKPSPARERDETLKADAPESPPAPRPGRAGRAPAPVAEEEVDLARLEGEAWEDLPPLVSDPIPPGARAGVEVGEAEDEIDPAELDDETLDEAAEDEAPDPTTRPARERAHPIRAASVPAGPTPVRRLIARLAGAWQTVRRSFSASTIGESLGKAVEVRVGTIVVVFVGIAIFGLLCYLLGSIARPSDGLAPLASEASLLLPEKNDRPAIRNTTPRTPAPEAKRAASKSDTKTGSPGSSPEPKRTTPAVPAAADLNWTIQVTAWRKKGEAQDKAFVEKLREGLGVSPVWSEPSSAHVTVFAGRYASAQDAQADLAKIRAVRLQGFGSFGDAYPFKKTRPAPAGR
ncbi:MAG: hypothetical protein JXP34_26540 [Planctomycetes bacterium]|nr:hypothetical protein [Planctomycetota bacterium]